MGPRQATGKCLELCRPDLHKKQCKQGHLELHMMSGFGVRPALISEMLCATTRSQYASVSGTTSSGTPACLHT